MKILISTIQTATSGNGHYVRCQSLKRSCENEGHKTWLTCIRENTGIRDNYLVAREKPILPRFYTEEKFDLAILDLWCEDCKENFEAYQIYILSHSKIAKQCIFIDGAQSDSVREHCIWNHGSLGITTLLRPYSGETSSREKELQILGGSEFAILSKEYQGLPKRTNALKVSRLLITCGGSDPTNITERTLEALTLIKDIRLAVKVIIGRNFTIENKLKIENHLKSSAHRVDLIQHRESIAGYLQWCDIAVCSSGITKYEMAATGTPALIIPLNARDEEINNAFAKEGTSTSTDHDSSPRKISEELIKLVQNHSMRKAQSEKGQKLIDGQGAVRLIQKLTLNDRTDS